MTPFDMTVAAAGAVVVAAGLGWWRAARRRRRRVDRARLRSQLAALRRQPHPVDPGAFGRLPSDPPDPAALHATWAQGRPTSSLSAADLDVGGGAGGGRDD